MKPPNSNKRKRGKYFYIMIILISILLIGFIIMSLILIDILKVISNFTENFVEFFKDLLNIANSNIPINILGG